MLWSAKLTAVIKTNIGQIMTEVAIFHEDFTHDTAWISTCMYLGWHLGGKQMLWKTKQQILFPVSAKTSGPKAKLPLPAANGWIHGRASQKDHDRGQACANQFHGDLSECSWKRVPKSWQPPESWSLDARPVSGFPAGGATGGSARRIMQTIPGCQGQVCWRRSEPSTAPAQKSSRAAPWQLRQGNPTILQRAPEGRRSLCCGHQQRHTHVVSLVRLPATPDLCITASQRMSRRSSSPAAPGRRIEARSRVARLPIGTCRGHHDAMVSEVDSRDQNKHWTNHDRSSHLP